MKTSEQIKKTIREWINNKTVRQYSMNTVWMMVARFSWIITAFTVGIFVTRKLGPEQFGVLNYAMAWIGMFTVFLDFGVGGIIQRDLVCFPEKKDRLLGNFFAFKIMQTILMLLTIGIVLIVCKQTPQVTKLILILMMGYFSVFLTALPPYFAATVKNEYEAFAQIISCFTYNSIRVCAVIFDWSLTAYAIAELALMVSYHFSLFCFYKKMKNSIFSLTFRFKEVFALFLPAVPLSLASIFGTIYSRTDILMLKYFDGFDSVGYYTLASRFTLNLTLFYGLLAGIFSTAVSSSKKISDSEYKKQLHRFYFMLFWIMVPFLPLFVFIAPYLFRFLYGSEFSAAAVIFSVCVFGLPCTGLLNAFYWHCTLENKLFLLAFSNGLGAFLNVIGNYILIPRMGAVGAAWSSIITMPLGLILSLLCLKSGREILKVMLKSLLTHPSFRLNQSGT